MLREPGEEAGLIKQFSIIGAVVLAAILAMLLFLPTKRAQNPPTMRFLCFTNEAGPTFAALFRVEHPPEGIIRVRVSDLTFQSPTGWTRNSYPPNFGFSASGRTSSIAWVEVENTNVPARVVVSFTTHRKNILGLYDLFRFQLATMQRKQFRLDGDILLLTNQTSVISP